MQDGPNAQTEREQRGQISKYRRGFRTTIWKNTGIRKSGRTLLLARAGPGSDHGVDPDRLGVLSSLGSPACVRPKVL